MKKLPFGAKVWTDFLICSDHNSGTELRHKIRIVIPNDSSTFTRFGKVVRTVILKRTLFARNFFNDDLFDFVRNWSPKLKNGFLKLVL